MHGREWRLFVTKTGQASPTRPPSLSLFFKILFIYLYLAVLGLHCGVLAQEHAGSVVAARGLGCPVACRILVP